MPSEAEQEPDLHRATTFDLDAPTRLARKCVPHQMVPGCPCDSIRLATFTVSPHRS
jgi:hypothetical protein